MFALKVNNQWRLVIWNIVVNSVNIQHYINNAHATYSTNIKRSEYKKVVGILSGPQSAKGVKEHKSISERQLGRQESLYFEHNTQVRYTISTIKTTLLSPNSALCNLSTFFHITRHDNNISILHNYLTIMWHIKQINYCTVLLSTHYI